MTRVTLASRRSCCTTFFMAATLEEPDMVAAAAAHPAPTFRRVPNSCPAAPAQPGPPAAAGGAAGPPAAAGRGARSSGGSSQGAGGRLGARRGAGCQPHPFGDHRQSGLCGWGGVGGVSGCLRRDLRSGKQTKYTYLPIYVYSGFYEKVMFVLRWQVLVIVSSQILARN